MAQVRKGNKWLTVDATEVQGYLRAGFDEVDETGKVVKTSPHRTYTAAEVEDIKSGYEKKIAALVAEVKKRKRGGEGTE